MDGVPLHCSLAAGALVAQAVNADRQVLASAAQRLQAQAAGMVKDGMTVFTTSYSSTIAQALVQAARGAEHGRWCWQGVGAGRECGAWGTGAVCHGGVQ